MLRKPSFVLAAFLGLFAAVPAFATTDVRILGTNSSGLAVPIGGASATSGLYQLQVIASVAAGGIDAWSQGATITAGQTTITGGSATQIAAASTTRRAITVRNDNTGTINVVLGPSGVTTTTGLTLVPGSAVTLSLAAGAALFGIQASGSPVVSWLSEGN